MEHSPSMAEIIAEAVMTTIEQNKRISKSDIEIAVQTAMLTHAAAGLPVPNDMPELSDYERGYQAGYDLGFRSGKMVVELKAQQEAEKSWTWHHMGTVGAVKRYRYDSGNPHVGEAGTVTVAERCGCIIDDVSKATMAGCPVHQMGWDRA